MTELTFRAGTENDKNRVKTFLLDNYFPDEPICKSEHAEIDGKNLDKIVKCLEYGTCTLAEDCDGKLIGVRLAEPSLPTDIESYNVKNPKTYLEKLWVFLYKIAQEANTFEKYRVEKVMHSMLLGVDKDYRSKGLGTQLYRENMKLAKKLGYSLYTCDCTSLYSAKACLNLGFDIVYEMPYADYKDENGVQIFKPHPPHDKIRVFAKLL